MNATWLLATFDAPGSVGAIWIQNATGLAVLVLALLVLTEVPALIRWVREEQPVARALAVLVVLGGLLRFAAPATQMDIHYRLRPAALPLELADSVYGLAFPSVVRALWLVFGSTDVVVHSFNLAMGTVSIALLFALSRTLGLSLHAAIIGSVLLAFSPAHAQFSHTDNQTILETTLTLWGIRSLVDPRGPHHHLIAAVALGLAAVLRPDALVVPLIAATAWSLSGRRPVWWDLLLFAALPLIVPSAAAWLGHILDESKIIGAFSRNEVLRHGLRHFLFLYPQWTHWLVPVGMVLALWALPSRKIAVWSGSWALLLSVLVFGFSVADLEHAGARHQLRAIPFVAMFAGIGLGWAVERVAERTRWAVWMAGAIGAGVSVAMVPAAIAPTTLSLEYGFVRDNVLAVPLNCPIIGHFQTLEPDKGLKPPKQLSWQSGRNHRWIDLFIEAPPEEGCLAYYRGSNCYIMNQAQSLVARLADGRLEMIAECRTLEASLGLTAVATAEIGATSHGTDRYPPDSVLEIGFFDVAGRIDDPPPRAVRNREVLERAVDDLASPVLPPNWSEEGVRAALTAHPDCPVSKWACHDGLCIAVSVATSCERESWRASFPGAVRFSWHRSGGGETAVALGLIPLVEGADNEATFRVANALAEGLLYEITGE